MKKETTQNLIKKIIIVIIIYAFTIRLYQYVGNRELWTDELFLFQAIHNKNYLDLTILDNSQIAPILFIYLTKFLLEISFLIDFFELNMILRIFPFIVSLISVLLFYKICQKFFCNQVIIFGIFIFSTSPNLIYYSQEFKQYSLDVFFTLLIFYYYSNFKEYKFKKKILLISAAFLSSFFSHASIFALGSTSIHSLIVNYKSGNIIKLLKIIFTGILFLISFFINYFFFIINNAKKTNITEFWTNNFLVFPNTIADIKIWIKIFGQFYTYSGFSILLSPLILFLTIIGIKVILKDKFNFLQIILITFFLLIIASMINKYPFGGRLILFAVPLFYLLLLSGLNYYYLSNSKFLKFFFTIFLVLSFTFHFVNNFNQIKKPAVGDINKLHKLDRKLLSKTKFKDIFLFSNLK